MNPETMTHEQRVLALAVQEIEDCTCEVDDCSCHVTGFAEGHGKLPCFPMLRQECRGDVDTWDDLDGACTRYTGEHKWCGCKGGWVPNMSLGALLDAAEGKDKEGISFSYSSQGYSVRIGAHRWVGPEPTREAALSLALVKAQVK